MVKKVTYSAWECKKLIKHKKVTNSKPNEGFSLPILWMSMLNEWRQALR